MAFLGCLTLVGVVVIAQGEDDPAPPRSGRSESHRARDGVGTCPDSEDTNTGLPTKAPDGVSWGVYHTVVVPTSEAYGPQVVEGDVARCYARTPTGALLAATQITIRSSLAEDWRPVITQQVTGAGVDELRAALRRSETSGQTIKPGQMGQFTGFRFITYDKTIAVISLVTRMPDGDLRSVTTTVRWSMSADDWQLEVPTGNVQTPDSLEDYTHWGGV
jgi:hypothetical protein